MVSTNGVPLLLSEGRIICEINERDMSTEHLDALCDVAVVHLWSAMARSLGVNFDVGPKATPSSMREIVTKWKPQLHTSAASDQFAARQQYVLSSFFNRYLTVEERLKSRDLEREAALKFLKTNADGWAIDEYVISHEALKPLIDKMTYIVADALPKFDLLAVYKSCKHGPNSTASIERSNAYLDVKDFDLTGTRHSLQQFRHYLTWDFSLRNMLIENSDQHRAWYNALDFSFCNVTDATETNFVPKKVDSLRTMCPEHTVPSWFGQGVGAELTKALKSIGIDLNTQPSVHQLLACLASKYPELGIATIDWSEASDRIWLALCKVVMREGNAHEWYRFIVNVCRCEFTDVSFRTTIGHGGDYKSKKHLLKALEEFYPESVDVELKSIRNQKKQKASVTVRIRTSMVGTMGNAVTFPLQTLIFYAFLTACTELAAERLTEHYVETHDGDRLEELQVAGMQPVSAFGDDGICDSRAEPEIRRYAELLGWRLNVEKSYFSGAFKESCGADYFAGRFCRPFQPKRPPTDPKSSLARSKMVCQSWIYVCGNACIDLLKHFDRGTYFIDRWVAEMHTLFRLGKVCVVPPSYSDGSGMRYEIVPHDHYDRWHPYFGAFAELDPRVYHIPYFKYHCGSPLNREIHFRCVSNTSPRRLATNEESFLVRQLKLGYDGVPRGAESVLQRDDDAWDARHLDFFDLPVKSQAVLDADGTLPEKECRLYKVSTYSLSWE